MTLIVYVFQKLETLEDEVRRMSKRLLFRIHIVIQHGKGCKSMLKSEAKHFYRNFLSLWGILSWIMSLLVISALLGLFFNLMTSDDKYFLPNVQNLPQWIQFKLFWISCFVCKNYIRFSTFFKKLPLRAYIFAK